MPIIILREVPLTRSKISKWQVSGLKKAYPKYLRWRKTLSQDNMNSTREHILLFMHNPGYFLESEISV